MAGRSGREGMEKGSNSEGANLRGARTALVRLLLTLDLLEDHDLLWREEATVEAGEDAGAKVEPGGAGEGDVARHLEVEGLVVDDGGTTEGLRKEEQGGEYDGTEGGQRRRERTKRTRSKPLSKS
jgi:hypothetical protein